MADLRYSPSLKKQRLAGVEETLSDRISQLPDSLLVDILSLLPTKDAFTSCILSKRWQFLWTSVYNFTFTYSDLQRTEDFGTFVDYVFANCTSPVVNKLDIDCTDIREYRSHFNGWLHFAAQRNVEHVVFRAEGDQARVKVRKFPESFRRCSSLKYLHFTEDCWVYFDAPVKWKSLKNIRVSLWDFDIPMNLLSGCPALEAMEIDGVDDVESLLSAKLTYENTCFNRGRIHGNGVEEEEESECYLYHGSIREEFKNTLQNLSDATKLTELTIGSWFTEVMCVLQLKGVPIPELVNKNLTLEVDIEDFSLYGAAGVLQASPHVETLAIDLDKLDQRYRCRYELKYMADGDKIDLESCIPSFEFPNLKNVKIVNSLGLCLKDYSKSGHDKLFKLSEFLLKGATELEKFVIISKTRRCKRCSMNCVSPYLFQLAEQLLGCPRSSNSVIIFQE